MVNEKTLKNLITYNNSVYNISEKFNSLERKNSKAKTKASTVAKMTYTSFLCGHKSINCFQTVNSNKSLDFKMIFRKNEYIPKTHGERDAIIDTDYLQIKKINEETVEIMKKNRVFQKNTIDGLCTMGWDGVETSETKKEIELLPEREYAKDDIRGYIKYLVAMNIGEKGNYIVNAKQLLEREKITTKRGNERAKTTGETTLFLEMFKETEKLTGRVIDVNVFDALFLTSDVLNMINDANKFFVIRLKDESRDIYKDAKGLFESIAPNHEYEIVEITTVKDIKYSKAAKKKDKRKTKVKKVIREITDEKLGEKKLIETNIKEKKNNTVKEKIYERVVARKKVWDDIFEMNGYKEKVRVVRSIETIYRGGKVTKQVLYVVTNMLNHNVETILKIMHLRWNIENCGFRTLKQRFHINHIFIGELNAINYIVQMIFLVFNLLELYVKVRLKNEFAVTWDIVFKLFERSLHSDKELYALFNPS